MNRIDSTAATATSTQNRSFRSRLTAFECLSNMQLTQFSRQPSSKQDPWKCIHASSNATQSRQTAICTMSQTICLSLLNLFQNVHRVESLNQKPYLTLSPNVKRKERNYASLNETSRNNYYRRNYMLENEIASLTDPTRLPTCFPNKLTQILRLSRMHRRCASFPIIIILVNPCSCLLPFFYEFIVKVK